MQTKSTSGTKKEKNHFMMHNALMHSELCSKVIQQTPVSQTQCQDCDSATVASAPRTENLGTSGKSLGERLAAGLGEGVRPE